MRLNLYTELFFKLYYRESKQIFPIMGVLRFDQLEYAGKLSIELDVYRVILSFDHLQVAQLARYYILNIRLTLVKMSFCCFVSWIKCCICGLFSILLPYM